MKKVILLLLMGTFLLTACSKKEETATSTDAQDPMRRERDLVSQSENNDPPQPEIPSEVQSGQEQQPTAPRVENIEKYFHGKEDFLYGNAFVLEEDRHLGPIWDLVSSGSPFLSAYGTCKKFLSAIGDKNEGWKAWIVEENQQVMSLLLGEISWPSISEIKMAEPFEVENGWTVNFRLTSSEKRWLEGELFIKRLDDSWKIEECRINPSEILSDRVLFEDDFEPEVFPNLGI